MKKYYSIEEIQKVEKPRKYGHKTTIIEDRINNIAFFKFEKTSELIEIEELKKQLAETDYQAIKYAEGQMSEEEYAGIKTQRQAWRDRINELEEKLSREGV